MRTFLDGIGNSTMAAREQVSCILHADNNMSVNIHGGVGSKTQPGQSSNEIK